MDVKRDCAVKQRRGTASVLWVPARDASPVQIMIIIIINNINNDNIIPCCMNDAVFHLRAYSWGWCFYVLAPIGVLRLHLLDYIAQNAEGLNQARAGA